MSVPSVGVPAFTTFQNILECPITGEDFMEVDAVIDPCGHSISKSGVDQLPRLKEKNGQYVRCEKGEEGKYFHCPLQQGKVISFTALYPNPKVKELARSIQCLMEMTKKSSDSKDSSLQMFDSESSSSLLAQLFSFADMKKPVVDPDGHTFDLSTIAENNNVNPGHIKCPNDGKLFRIDELYQHKTMKQVCEEISTFTEGLLPANHQQMSKEALFRSLQVKYFLLIGECKLKDQKISVLVGRNNELVIGMNGLRADVHSLTEKNEVLGKFIVEQSEQVQKLLKLVQQEREQQQQKEEQGKKLLKLVQQQQQQQEQANQQTEKLVKVLEQQKEQAKKEAEELKKEQAEKKVEKLKKEQAEKEAEKLKKESKELRDQVNSQQTLQRVTTLSLAAALFALFLRK